MPWFHYSLDHKSAVIQAKLSKNVLKSNCNLNSVKPLAVLNHVLSQTLWLAPADWWSAWQMKHISPLIFFGTVWSKPTAAMAKWGHDSISNRNKVSLCVWCIRLCKLLLHASWEQIQQEDTLLPFRNALALQRAFVCGDERLASVNIPFSSTCQTVIKQ